VRLKWNVFSLMAMAVSVLTMHAQEARLLVAQKGEHSLAIVDPDAGKVLGSVDEGGITGHEVIASRDGRTAFVPIYGNSGVGKPGTDGTKIVAIDIASQKVVGTHDFARGVRPHCPLIGPKDGLLYVTTELDKTISILDPKTLTIVGTIPTGQPESHMLVLSHDGRRGYTANVGVGTVSVLDIAGRKTLKVISISGNTQRIAISNDDRWVFTADQTKPQIAVIDTKTDTVAKWVPIKAAGYGSAPTPDGHWLLMAMPQANEVAVVDLTTMTATKSVPVCADPQEVLVRPDGKAAYVSCMSADRVAEIDLGRWQVTRTIATGKSTDGLAWAAGQ
jgi:DNA-binding beta-propeller fold protein YncE